MAKVAQNKQSRAAKRSAKSRTEESSVHEVPKPEPTAEAYDERDRRVRGERMAEIAALNGKGEGRSRGLGALVQDAIAPEWLSDLPYESTILHHLAMEIMAVAAGIEDRSIDEVELPYMLRRMAVRAEAQCVLADRLRDAQERGQALTVQVSS